MQAIRVLVADSRFIVRQGIRALFEEVEGIALAGEAADGSRVIELRELQIVRHVFSDHKKEHIARRLDISPHTVHTYVNRIYHKLRVNSRVQMVIRVFAEHLRLNHDERTRLPEDSGSRPGG